MPSTSGVTVSLSPDRSRAVVRLRGDLDMSAQTELDDALLRLVVAAPGLVDVDVAAVTYVGSTLPNFLVQVRRVLPAESRLTVSRPAPWTRFILRVTRMAEIAEIDGADPRAAAAGR